MISLFACLILVGFGSLLTLFAVIVGTVLHMRYLDRKLIKPRPAPQAATQQIKAVKP